MSNTVLTMRQVRTIIGMDDAENRYVAAKLRIIAEQRGVEFQLFKLGGSLVTTKADMRRLLPELYAHEGKDAVTMGDEIASLKEDVALLKGKLARLEKALSVFACEGSNGQA